MGGLPQRISISNGKFDLEELLMVESPCVLEDLEEPLTVEGDLFDVESKNAISGLRGTQEDVMEDKSINVKGSKSCDEKLVVEEEIPKCQESDGNEKEADRRLNVEQRSAALVCKVAEVIIDCDSD